MKRALLVIDVQNEYFTGALPITHPAGTPGDDSRGNGRQRRESADRGHPAPLSPR